MAEKKNLFMISHTHWDREWYLAFNEFRLRLINVVDKALALASNPRWNSFMLDGQTAPLEDYLEVRQGQENALRNAIAGGKLVVGPWYVLADEFLESAEGLVRNLLIGHAIAARYGTPMHVGYVPDTFGHVWQLPQILAGFNIKSCYLFRGYPPLFGGHEEAKGLNDKTPLEFHWASPDGTKVLTLHHIKGYGNASHLSEGAATGEYQHMGALVQILSAVERLAPRSATKNFLIMNGTDHLFPDENVPDIVDFFNKDEELSEAMVLRHAKLEDYFNDLQEVSSDFQVLAGEMRGSAYTQVTPACLSSRMYLKLANWEASTELENWTEMLCSLAWYLGANYPSDEIMHAWKLLLKNHPHDSICGCSIDRVHDDMETRFAEIMDVLQTLGNGAAAFIMGTIPRQEGKRVPLVVFNATNWMQSGPVRVLLAPPLAFQDKEILVVDENGEPVPCQATRIIEDYRNIEEGDRLYPLFGNRFKLHEVEFIAGKVPALGFKKWFLEPSTVPAAIEPASGASNVLENEHLKATIHADGTVSLHHKKTGKTWNDIFLFEDEGDDGDEYDYAPMHEPAPVHSRGLKATVGPVTRDGVKQQAHVQVVLPVPACITKNRKRSDVMVDLPVHVLVVLYPGERFLRVTIDVDNFAEDHRLRVLFPTDPAITKSCAADHFMVMERPVTLPKDDGWYQPAQGLYHADGFVDMSDGKTGLAIHARGLPEFEIVERERNAIAFTLFRSVGWLSRDGMPVSRGHLGRPSGLNGPFLPTPGAQCKRRMRFELAVHPHAGSWEEAGLFKVMKLLHVPLRAATPTSSARDFFYVPQPRFQAPIPLEKNEEGFITVEPGSLVVSAVKKAEREDAVVVRVYNPTGQRVQGTLRVSFGLARASLVNLNEEFVESLLDVDGTIDFSIKGSQILTFSLVPRRSA